MNIKLLKLPFLTIIGGFVLKIIHPIFVRIIASGMDPSAEWGLELFYIDIVLSIIIIIAIGMILRRTYDKDTFIKASTLLVIYSFIVLIIIERLFYSRILYLPIEIFEIAIISLSLIIPWKTGDIGFIFIKIIQVFYHMFFYYLLRKLKL